MRITSIILGILCAVFFARPAMAATEITTGGLFAARLEPKNPGPKTPVKATISSFAHDFKRSDITWTVNGKQVAKGIGADTIQFTTGSAGTKTIVRATIATEDGQRLEKTITILPAQLSLAWEAETTAPELYRGKKMPSKEATVRLLASIEGKTSTGKTLSSDDLVFTWTHDGRALPGANGKGRFTTTITTPTNGDSTKIHLLAATNDNSVVVEGEVTIPLVEPFVLLYENEPLQGVSQNAVGDNISLQNDELTLEAEPYFFSGTKEDLSFVWRLGEREIETSPANPRSVTLRTGAGSGKNQLTLLVRNTGKLFQEARARLTIFFSGQ